MMANDILSRIVATKKQEVEAARAKLPESKLREAAGLRREKRPFFDRLSKPGRSGANIIAEIKRASPSKGDIRVDLDPAGYARKYQDGGAAAISVLTDGPYFKGSFDDFKLARKAASLPMIRKDFIISSYQIYESAVLGADAILLIVRILTEQQIKDYLALCREIGLDVLVEIHSEQELKTATKAGAVLVGINNRNLKSFETSTQTTLRLASGLQRNQIGVAESGIKGREDIEAIMDAGIFNFLIGESAVRAEDTRAFLRSLQTGSD